MNDRAPVIASEARQSHDNGDEKKKLKNKMNMKRLFKTFLLLKCMFLLLAFSAVDTQAQSVNSGLEGTWKLEKCEIQKDSAGIKSKVNYLPTDENISRWYVFTELTFGKDKSCLTVINNDEITGEYKHTDTGLVLDIIIMVSEYSYSLTDDNTLVLKRRQHYYHHDNTGYFEDIEITYAKNRTR